MKHILEQIAPRWSTDPALHRVQVQHRLSRASGVDDNPERLPHPLRARQVFIGLPDSECRCPRGTFLLPAGSPPMRQDPYDWPRVGGFVVVWLVIAVVAGMGLLALFDPGSIQVLVTAGL